MKRERVCVKMRKSYLALFSTFVVVFTWAFLFAFSKGTKAIEEVPANESFDDIQFYRCVVETYNTLNGTNLEYTESLTDEQLKTITKMDCNSSGREDSEKILSIKGIDKLEALTDLNLSSNKLTSIDLSHNVQLEKLDIHDNPFFEELYVYNGDNITLGANIQLPSGLEWENPTWVSDDSSIVSVSDEGVITGEGVGTVSVRGTVVDQYATESLVHVKSISTDTYLFHESDGYIVIPGKLDIDVIRSNIHVDDDLSIDMNSTNYTLEVKRENMVIKAFKIVNYSSNLYAMDKDYIYVGNGELSLEDIDVIHCTKEVVGDKLLIKYMDTVIKESPIVSINFSDLSVFNKTISLNEEMDYDTFISNISASGDVSYVLFNGETEVNSGNVSDGMQLKVYYQNEEIDSYHIKISQVDNPYSLEFDSSLIVNQDKKYINYIITETKVVNFLEKVKVTGGNVRVVVYVNSKHEKEKEENDLVGSGNVLTVYADDKIMEEYELSVLGDANGDGYFNQIDLVQMRKHMAGWVNPVTNVVFEKTGIYSYAIDMDKNGVINQIDLVRMRKRIAGVG